MGASAPSPEAAAGEGMRPVDLAHLARQTHGDRDLEREVLHLFLRQSETVLARLAAGEGGRAELAHRLLGSARGVGAHRVAAAAERLETATGQDAAAALDALSAAVGEANGYIRALLAA